MKVIRRGYNRFQAIKDRIGAVYIRAKQVAQLDPQSLVAHSVRVLIGSPLFIAGKLPETLGSCRCPQMFPSLCVLRSSQAN